MATSSYDPPNPLTSSANPYYTASTPPSPTRDNPDVPLLQHHEPPRRNLRDILRQNMGTVFVIAIALVMASLVLTVVVTLEDLDLKTNFSQFRVDSVSIPNFNPSSKSLVNWNVDFVVVNPTTRHVVFHDPITVSVYYQNHFLGETTANPFVRNEYTTTMSAKFATPGTKLNGVYHRNSGKHVMGLNFRVKGDLRFVYGGRGYWRIWVFCDNVMVAFSTESGVGALYSAPKNCRVQI
ncbi:hypothetical protein ACHQM5_019481 [Ranunculus cassubicifolius]